MVIQKKTYGYNMKDEGTGFKWKVKLASSFSLLKIWCCLSDLMFFTFFFSCADLHWAQIFSVNSATFSIPSWCIQPNRRWRRASARGSESCWLEAASQGFLTLWEANPGRQTNTPQRVRLIPSSPPGCGPEIKMLHLHQIPLFSVYQYAVLQVLGGSPVKHASTVIFHFSLFKVEIFSLVVGETYWKRDTVVILVSATTSSTRGPANRDILENYVVVVIV